jgi:hypothetical protein
MIAAKHILLAEFRLPGTLSALPRQTAGETKGKQNSTKTTFFPSIMRANFPLEKIARSSQRKISVGNFEKSTAPDTTAGRPQRNRPAV